MEKNELKILIVEDGKNYVSIYQSVLYEYSLEIVSNKSEALKCLEKNYHLIILNWNLTNSMDRQGMQLLLQIEESKHPAKIIIITADASISYKEILKREIVLELFMKGVINRTKTVFTLDRLVALIEEFRSNGHDITKPKEKISPKKSRNPLEPI